MANTKDSSASGRLLAALYTTGSLSRAQATAQTGLARSAAGNAVAELEELGLIWALPPEAADGLRGRPSPKIGVLPGGATAIAVDLRRDNYVISAVDLTRHVRWQESFTFDAAGVAPEQTLSTIAADVTTLIASHGETRVAGVGLSIPGIVAGPRGVAKAVLALGWKDVPAGDLLRAGLDPLLPVAVGHDATLGALAEFRGDGGGHDAKRLLYLTAQPRGLGAAMISASSELGMPELHGLQAGHLSIDPGGILCSCGSHGCLELYVDGACIRTELGLSDAATLDDIDEALVASGSFDDSLVMRALQLGLVALINTLAPDRVVLSGALTPVAHHFADRLDLGLSLSVVAQVQQVLIRPAELSEAVAIGAAERAFGALLRDPAAFAHQHGWAVSD